MLLETLYKIIDDVDDWLGLVRLGVTPGGVATVAVLLAAIFGAAIAPEGVWTIAAGVGAAVTIPGAHVVGRIIKDSPETND